ncbi:MAG: NAD(P)/FAD-dependent oxidoreductase [Desulfocapsaceae bacterium]|jgi:predicted Rossmann fold flavoprotein|nr:NAD(P)/FAD-dependent oxidoreductase [Desulfocapsaceae bacterium]
MTGERVIVVGAGAAGLMAAGIAAECGADVLLLEKMSSPARKIRISGKGRCNLSNVAELSDFIAHFGKSGLFLRQLFSTFFTPELIAFFESRGLKLQVERGGRIFPVDGDAPAVARLLLNWVEQSGVAVKTEEAVQQLIIKDGRVTGVVCAGRRIQGDAVIMATGGASYSRTGSTGDGYRLLEDIGHTLVPVRPALVALETQKSAVRGLAGLELRNIMLRLYIDGKRRDQKFGELSFTPSGLGGPIVLTMSLMAVDAIRQNKSVSVSLDLKPALDDAKLDARLLRDIQKRGKEPMASVLRGLIPQQLVETCLQETQIPHEQPAGASSAAARRALRHWLKDFRFEIIGHRPLEEAIVTAGGIATREINPHTMESKIIKGLYVVGELLDIQGDTGGYNLQAAFSTGWAAGKAAGCRSTSGIVQRS